MAGFIDITGQKFGRLLVKKVHHKDKRHKVFWECLCDCGNTIVVSGSHLKTGHTQSCGCIQKEKARKTMTTHGLYNVALNRVRRNMIDRCYDTKNIGYKNYEERGIKVCNEWVSSPLSFYTWALATGYQKGLSIDRINNDGDYTPSNCKWSTRKE